MTSPGADDPDGTERPADSIGTGGDGASDTDPVVPSDPEVTTRGPAGKRAPRAGVVGTGDSRPFLGDSPVDPLQRLARFRPVSGPASPETPGKSATGPAATVEETSNGSSGGEVPDQVTTDPGSTAATAAGMSAIRPEQFAAVGKRDLAGVPRVYVFVHGWVPGSRATADSLIAEDGSVEAWDERVANTVGESMVASYSPLLSALAGRDPEAAVLWFSWVDQSSTDTEFFAARDSFRNTEVNGRRLAIALQKAFGDVAPAVHLIGHSHGCVVAAHAALALREPPRQLTVLDCPEDWFSRAGGAAGLLGNILPRLQPGRGESATFVDAYASMFGRSYHGKPGLGAVVDVRLTPKFSSEDEATATSQAHHFAVDWYAGTATDRECDYGFGWSPMLGFDTVALDDAYVAGFGSSPISLSSYRPGNVVPAEGYQVDHQRVLPQVLKRNRTDMTFVLPIDPSVVLIEFDYEIVRPGRRTMLQVAVDRQAKFEADARYKVPGRGRYLRLDPGTDKSAVVQFRVRDPGLLSAVKVQRIRTLRTRSRRSSRNYDERRAAVAIAMLGAVAGAAATLTALGALAGTRRLLGGRGR